MLTMSRKYERHLDQRQTQIRSFLGLTRFYRGYIDKYTEIAEPLTDLSKKKSPNVIKWGEMQEKAFTTLKRLLVTEPVLRLPDMSKPFVLRTDTSDVGIGAVLLQQHEEKLFPVAYASKKLLPRKGNYSTMEKECLAVVWAVKRFNVYLYGAPFVVTNRSPAVGVSESYEVYKWEDYSVGVVFTTI